MLRIVTHGLFIVLLTVFTQLGGLAWALALMTRRRLLTFAVAYVALWGAAMVTAPLFGRVALTCWQDGPLQVHSWVYCATNRTYVSPQLAQALRRAAVAVDAEYPGTITQVLDGNFPFGDGVPLLPHLSHDDGEKADLAFHYIDDTGDYLPGRTRSPVGYFAFEQGPTDCPPVRLTLRWNMGWLQPVWPEWRADPDRTRSVIMALAQDPSIGKIFVEPHMVAAMGLAHPKVRFQGCRAARHDDHIHVQL